MVKKIMSLLVLMSISFMLFSQDAYAQETEGNEDSNYSSNVTVEVFERDGIQVTRTSRMLSMDEAIEVLMEKEGISFEEAQAKIYNVVAECNPSMDITSLQSIDADLYRFEANSETLSFSGCEIEIGGLWYVYRNISFRQFEKNVSVWSGAVGNGAYTWEEDYVADTTEKYPTTVATVEGRGVIDSTVEISGGSQVTIGGVVHYRLVCDLDFEWSLY